MPEELNGIQVSEYNESADKYCKFLFDEIKKSEGFKTLEEISDWVEEIDKENSDGDFNEGEDSSEIKKIYWMSDKNEGLPLGIGFVNYQMRDLREGLYFRDPDWCEGKVCRVNNQYDIALFILAARELKKLNDRGRVCLSTLD